MSYLCLSCSSNVRARQEALCCDGCDRWQHRACGTGISRQDYRRIVKGLLDLPKWFCLKCEHQRDDNNDVGLSASMLQDDMYPIRCGDLDELDSQQLTVNEKVSGNKSSISAFLCKPWGGNSKRNSYRKVNESNINNRVLSALIVLN